MKLIDILEKLNCLDKKDNFVPEYLNMEFVQQPDDLVLDRESVIANARYCGLDEAIIGQMADAAEFAAADETLGILVKFVFRCNFLNRLDPRWDFDTLELAAGGRTDALMLVIASGYVPLMRKLHAELGVAESITRDTCYQVRRYCENHIFGAGRYGVYPGQLRWLLAYTHPENLYIRLGRLEFQYGNCYMNHRIYRSRKDRSFVRFAAPGMNFDARGFAVTGDPESPERVFSAIFSEDAAARTATGNPVDENGKTSPETITISLDDYELVLCKGMPVLNMHIPSGGAMTPAATERSLHLAKGFFSGYFKEEAKRPVAVVCGSWIFNPNLPEFLAPDSNLVLMEKRVHLMPCSCCSTDGLGFIFRYGGAFDINTAAQKTSLQRAVLDYIKRGNRWRTGNMYLMMDEI